ncbi:hypothetical protein CBW52_18785 [Yersinia kristensenii]|uniref:Uncharacterized protein n=1 Tax=Yersinia kristensenii TaxID=28152 RepID=A0AB73NGW7_YERKR|nr:hypothetical protein CBW52_18785 [Yersinia kristensenii]
MWGAVEQMNFYLCDLSPPPFKAIWLYPQTAKTKNRQFIPSHPFLSPKKHHIGYIYPPKRRKTPMMALNKKMTNIMTCINEVLHGDFYAEISDILLYR